MNTTASTARGRVDPEHVRPANLKFTEVDYVCLKGLAWARRTTVSSTIRTAIDEYLARRRASPAIALEIDAAKARDAERREALFRAIAADDAADLQMPPVRQLAETAVEVRPVTIRLSAPLVNKLTAFAMIDDNTVARQIRRAIEEHLDLALTVSREEFASKFTDPATGSRLSELVRSTS